MMISERTRAATAPTDIPGDYTLWPLSVAQYHAMARAGVLTEDDPVELLEGWLVYKMTKNPPHSAATRYTRTALEALVSSAYFVDSQEPITLMTSEPEPNVVVVRGSFDDYLDHHPGADDVALVVEVADATLVQDRGSKKRIYARAGIPVYWIVNLVDRQIEVYSNPSGAVTQPDYHRREDYLSEDDLPVLIDGDSVGHIAVRDLLP